MTKSVFNQLHLTVLSLTAACAFLAAGCASSVQECDPSVDPGFFGKIGCTFSGSYAERVEIKEADLEKAKQENESLKKLYAQLENEEAWLSRDVEVRNAQIAAVESDLKALRSELEAQGRLNADAQKAIEEAQNQLNAMQSSPANAAILEKRQQRDALQAELDALAEAVYGAY
ncbi:MAG: hypothetical protein IAB19_02830 [Proteobacteria bacterium]|uniref:Lipoprotein n=1 Tax=Candidatus Avisuccinivibrio stercorigallinarum TaxID=2840704 RepID=A0A9D9GSC6_9GAMM|nr:hypothetical protein [Candidatus Avisuccinivibrio stercorigallinarum]